jgi:hypothetical protein
VKPLASAILIVSLAAAPAAAQGRGKAIGKARGGPTTSGSAAPTASSATASSEVGIRQYGAWLDDASLLDPGNAWTALSFGHYRTSAGNQTDFPVIDASVGLARRMQFGVTVPYYRVHFADGSTLHGLGDVYLSGKFSLIDPTREGQPFGLALSPMIELLDEATSNTGRFAWAVPINAELRRDRYRVFGSTGYFSRGAVFFSTALEVPVNDRVVLTGALSMMRSTNDDLTADSLKLPKGRADATATAAYFLTPSIAVFGGVGRTISSVESSGTSFMLSGGLSMTFAPRITP